MNDQRPALVSVVIPTHNQCRFLSAAIESAFAQTYPKVEVVVVDSGSTDSTGDVLASYDGRITYRREANVGPSKARNLGAALAQGEILVFLDGDDLLAPSCIEHRVALLASQPDAELVVGALRIVDAEVNPLRTEGLPYESGQRLSYEEMLGTMYGPTCGLTVRKSAYEALQGYDESLMIAEDSDFVIRASLRAPLVYDDEPLADYRQAGASLSRRWVLWYDCYRQMVDKLRKTSPDPRRYDEIVLPKFRDMACNLIMAKPIKDRGLAGIPVVLGILAKRPALIPFLGYWIARMVRNRLRRTAQTPT